MNAENIAQQARKSLSSFCMEECRAYCCRKGYLVMTLKEAECVTDNNIKSFQDKGIIKPIQGGRYSFDLKNNDIFCPRLKDFKCIVHKERNRPLACKEFPLFIEKDLIKLAPSCPAVQSELLYPYVCKLLKLGYSVSKTNPYSFLDMNRLDCLVKDEQDVKA